MMNCGGVNGLSTYNPKILRQKWRENLIPLGTEHKNYNTTRLLKQERKKEGQIIITGQIIHEPEKLREVSLFFSHHPFDNRRELGSAVISRQTLNQNLLGINE